MTASGPNPTPYKVLVTLLGEGRKALQDLRPNRWYLYGDTEDICADSGQQTVVTKALETPDQVGPLADRLIVAGS